MLKNKKRDQHVNETLCARAYFQNVRKVAHKFVLHFHYFDESDYLCHANELIDLADSRDTRYLIEAPNLIDHVEGYY
jgi:hypothetical protein